MFKQNPTLNIKFMKIKEVHKHCKKVSFFHWCKINYTMDNNLLIKYFLFLTKQIDFKNYDKVPK